MSKATSINNIKKYCQENTVKNYCKHLLSKHDINKYFQKTKTKNSATERRQKQCQKVT